MVQTLEISKHYTLLTTIPIYKLLEFVYNRHEIIISIIFNMHVFNGITILSI